MQTAAETDAARCSSRTDAALRMNALRPLLTTGFVVAFVSLAGCGSTRQIETSPPQPAHPAASRPADVQTAAALAVVIETGETPLPGDVQALRFRVADVHLKPRDGAWTTYPADVNSFELRNDGRGVRRTVLVTRVPPLAYDSLAVGLGSVYVEYGPNAGGPLSLAGDAPVRLAFPFHPAATRPSTLTVTFEPGASLSRTADCRWFFVPFLSASLDAAARP